MNTLADNIDGAALEAAWSEFNRIAELRSIRSEAEYDRVIALMNRVLDITGDDEQHPLSSLLELLALMIRSHEQEHHSLEELR